MIAESLLPEFDHEMGTTRKYLDRLPEAHASFKPHEKSMGLAQLASHIAEMVGWVVPTLNADELDIAGYQPNVVAARAAIEQMEDRDWNKPWALKMGGHTAFTMPKIGVVRSMILNHIIHHRGQLSVYYREVGVPVPATYGPSADER
jgi:DinB family